VVHAARVSENGGSSPSKGSVGKGTADTSRASIAYNMASVKNITTAAPHDIRLGVRGSMQNKKSPPKDGVQLESIWSVVSCRLSSIRNDGTTYVIGANDKRITDLVSARVCHWLRDKTTNDPYMAGESQRGLTHSSFFDRRRARKPVCPDTGLVVD